MMYKIVLVCALFLVVYSEDLCKICNNVPDSPVCGSDGITYASLCKLVQIECQEAREIGMQCNGTCPCSNKQQSHDFLTEDDKLTKLHKEDLQNYSEDIMMVDVLEKNEGIILNGEDKMVDLDGCPLKQMAELPRRLIDWFHVLKTNELEKESRSKNGKGTPVLKEMKFTDARLKAMYSQLSCSENTPEVESAVCLPSVKWMFAHLDTQQENEKGDGSLSAVELADIEEISNENCIKPFLKKCDSNDDDRVVLSEFCRCLCLTPPCTASLASVPTIVLKGKLTPFPGLFTPKCDEDGFYMPTQQNKRRREFWCVDRNGAEIEGTRSTERNINCHINTRSTNQPLNLIPMDIDKENRPVGSSV